MTRQALDSVPDARVVIATSPSQAEAERKQMKLFLELANNEVGRMVNLDKQARPAIHCRTTPIAFLCIPFFRRNNNRALMKSWNSGNIFIKYNCV